MQRWRERIERAVTLLNARLDDPPSLQELAAAAGVSPFHLHRVWHSLVGETVRQTVRRLRVEASEELLKHRVSVTETAMALGFGTPQSYARAFRRETGLSPSEHQRACAPAENAPYRRPDVVLEHRGEVLVVALRREGKPYTDLNATFGGVWNWAVGRSLGNNLTGTYGVPLDDPANVCTEELRYDACLALGKVKDPTPPLRLLFLPGGEYAVLRHKGAYDALDDLNQYLVGEWLPSSGREPADFPVYHQFLNDPDHTPLEDLLTHVLLPLKQLEICNGGLMTR